MGYIYKIVNKVNNKIYVGKTSKTIEHRYARHIKNARKHINRYLYDAMNHYGYNNFYIEQLEEVDNKKLNIREKYWIKFFNSDNSMFGYNMTQGGDGGDTLNNKSPIEKEKYSKKFRKGYKKGLDIPECDEHLLLDKLKTSDKIDIVADYFGVSRGTIYVWCAKFFNKKPGEYLSKNRIPSHDKLHRKHILSNIDKNKLLLDLTQNKLSKKDISKKYNITEYLLDKYLIETFKKSYKEIKGEDYRKQPLSARNKISSYRKGKKLEEISKTGDLSFIQKSASKRKGENNCNYKHVDKKVLFDYLCDSVLTIQIIAKKFNVSVVTIYNKMREYFGTVERNKIINDY